MRHPGAPEIAQHFYHKSTFVLRLVLTVGFVASVLFTPWAAWLTLGQVAPELQVLGDLAVLVPFFVGALILWLSAFSVEQAARMSDPFLEPDSKTQTNWNLRRYLDFNIRHHLLVVAAPLTLILLGANIVRGRERFIRDTLGAWWAPDALLGVVACTVFLLAPAMLCRIWRTTPIEPGELRTKLEKICRRINLRVRNILLWNTDGLLINAAVMGIIPQVRYVLLSDALLASMTDQQIEAVFGHEAGHVRHRHIQYFLLFAFVGWIVVAGLMELLAHLSLEGRLNLSLLTIQTIGVVATLAIWGIGFGWLSRRFERQADMFGAFCVTPTVSDCKAPCSVHLADGTDDQPARGIVCATGASVFASALERVAVLNGIAPEEKSWRHSSIAYRVRFLLSLAADPKRARRFEMVITRAKRFLLAAAIIGAAAALGYWKWSPRPALLRMQAGVTSEMMVSPAKDHMGKPPVG